MPVPAKGRVYGSIMSTINLDDLVDAPAGAHITMDGSDQPGR
jgi:hypothetical protein